MSSAHTVGIRVIDDVFAFLGIPVHKVEDSPITRRGFDALVRALVTSMETAAAPERRRAVNAAVERLDRDWGRLSETRREEAFQEAGRVVAERIAAGAAATTAPIEHATHGMFQAARQATARAHGLTLDEVFTARDVRAALHAQRSAGFFMRTKGGQIVGGAVEAAARRVVQRGIEEGWDHRETGREMEIVLARTIGARSRAYHEMVASVALTRARTYSQLQAFEDAGITTYEFRSVLDEATSDICRFLHGQTFDVRTVLKRFVDVDAGAAGGVVDLQPFARVGKRPDGSRVLLVESGGQRTEFADVVRSAVGQRDQVGEFRARVSGADLQRLGCCQPPLHPHCRSTLVPGSTNVISVPVGPGVATPRPVAPPAVGPFEVVVENGRSRIGPPPKFLPVGSDYAAEWAGSGAHMDASSTDIEAICGAGRVPSIDDLAVAWVGEHHRLQLDAIRSEPNELVFYGNIRNRAGTVVNTGKLVERRLRRQADGFIAHHEYLVLKEGATPRGFSSQMVGRAMRLYSHLGVDAVQIGADWSGKYVWPSMGFDWLRPQRQKSDIIEPFQRFLVRHGYTEDKAKDEAERCAEHPWLITDLSDGTMYDVRNRNPGGMGPLKLRLGQKFMYEQGSVDVYVRLDLRDVASPSFIRAQRKLLKP